MCFPRSLRMNTAAHTRVRLIEELLELVRGRANVLVLDIDSRDDWRESYDTRVPVLELDGQVLCEYSLDRDLVLTALSGLAEAG